MTTIVDLWQWYGFWHHTACPLGPKPCPQYESLGRQQGQMRLFQQEATGLHPPIALNYHPTRLAHTVSHMKADNTQRRRACVWPSTLQSIGHHFSPSKAAAIAGLWP